ncbi:MAG: hypothetical protein M1820_002785 [Bogoriella megaspora]|nr:MAG: hypothetical protein M1820_002785 [Bogoriella megaspora]
MEEISDRIMDGANPTASSGESGAGPSRRRLAANALQPYAFQRIEATHHNRSGMSLLMWTEEYQPEIPCVYHEIVGEQNRLLLQQSSSRQVEL